MQHMFCFSVKGMLLSHAACVIRVVCLLCLVSGFPSRLQLRFVAYSLMWMTIPINEMKRKILLNKRRTRRSLGAQRKKRRNREGCRDRDEKRKWDKDGGRERYRQRRWGITRRRNMMRDDVSSTGNLPGWEARIQLQVVGGSWGSGAAHSWRLFARINYQLESHVWRITHVQMRLHADAVACVRKLSLWCLREMTSSHSHASSHAWFDMRKLSLQTVFVWHVFMWDMTVLSHSATEQLCSVYTRLCFKSLLVARPEMSSTFQSQMIYI